MSKQKLALVVDDEPGVRGVVEDVFRIAGREVLAVSDAEDAWHCLRLEPEKFDLVISDYEMPEMTGLDLLRLCRVDRRLEDIRFVLMSGGRTVSSKDHTSLEEVCARYSAQFLKKPFSVAILEEIAATVV